MIRRATPADLPGLADAIRAAYAPYIKAGLDIPPVDQGLDADLRDNHVWVAVDGTGVLGGVVLVLTGDSAHLANLAVHPDGAGRGLGRDLISVAMDAARATGQTEIVLVTHQDMTATRAFYERLDWTKIGQDGNKIMMSISL